MNNSIFIINSDGTGKLRLNTDGSSLFNPNFVAVGEKIVYSSYVDEHSGIFILDTDVSNRKYLVPGRNPLVSSDGQNILLRTYSSQLAVTDLSGVYFNLLTSSGNDTIHKHSWNEVYSPDGEKIIYNYLRSTGVEDLERVVYRMSTNGATGEF